MDKNILRELLKNLQIMMRCPHCGKPYNLDEIQLKGFALNTYMLKMECSNCHLPVQANITVSEGSKMRFLNGFPSIPPIPREQNQIQITPKNTYQKPKKFQKPISTDEVIDFHKNLKDFKGGLDSIL